MHRPSRECQVCSATFRGGCVRAVAADGLQLKADGRANLRANGLHSDTGRETCFRNRAHLFGSAEPQANQQSRETNCRPSNLSPIETRVVIWIDQIRNQRKDKQNNTSNDQDHTKSFFGHIMLLFYTNHEIDYPFLKEMQGKLLILNFFILLHIKELQEQKFH